jgi:hypothetical protein
MPTIALRDLVEEEVETLFEVEADEASEPYEFSLSPMDQVLSLQKLNLTIKAGSNNNCNGGGSNGGGGGGGSNSSPSSLFACSSHPVSALC